MKDLVIVFLLALAIGSFLNSWKWTPEAGSEPPSMPSPNGSPATAGPVSNVSDSTFDQQVLKAEVPVLVDFWAPWCGPCKAMGPVVEELARENQGRLKVVKLNIDESPKTAASFSISSIPAFYLFKGGRVVDKLVGAAPKNVLAQSINKALGSSPPYDAFASAPQPGGNEPLPDQSQSQSDNQSLSTNAINSLSPLLSSTALSASTAVTAENAEIPMLDETGFDRDVIKSATPVLVFFCDSSAPCNKIWPTVLSVADKASDRYRFVRVDIAAHPALAQEYYVSAVPTFIIFKDGKRTKQTTGVLPEQSLLSFLELPNTAAALGTGTF